MTEPINVNGLRLDKWLWYARFFKTRALARKAISAGIFRLNGEVMSKPHRQAKQGQELTFVQGSKTRTVRVKSLSVRRGPAEEASLLFDDLAPKVSSGAKISSKFTLAFEDRAVGSGRPTKRQRRETDKLKTGILEAEDKTC